MTVVQDIPNFSPKTIRNLTSSFNNIVPFDKLGRKKYLNFDDILALLESPKESGRPSNVINTVSDFLQIVREDCDEYVVSEILYRVTKNLDHEFLIEHMMLVLSKGEFNIQSDTISKLIWTSILAPSPDDFTRALRHAGYICRYKIKEIEDLLKKEIESN